MGGGGGVMEIVLQRPRLSGVYPSSDAKVRSPYSCFLERKERWLWVLDLQHFFFHSFKVCTAEAISLLSCMEVFKNSGSCILTVGHF